MKYGLLYYKDTDNVGDDIQSYAAARFLPRIDYMIDREKLEVFVPKKKEFVYTIMNAWYVHDKFNFNFSPYIYPLYTSMFFKTFPYEMGVTYGTDYLNDNIKKDLKKYGPVGTRDLHTKKILDKLNIDNYFSGCMTLTLEKFPNVKKENYIVAVGLTDDEIEYLKSKTSRPIKVYKQDVKKGSFSKETWEKRKKRAENVLKLYQGAHMVITNKLHCSLPCLALETPVLLLYDDSFPENKDRIGTYLEYLNHINRKKLKETYIDFEKPKSNPKKYINLREKLIKKCSDFVLDNHNNEVKYLPSIKDYEFFVNESINSRKPIIKHFEKLMKLYEEECEKASIMHDKYEKLYWEYKSIEKRFGVFLKIFNKIKNSLLYKCINNKENKKDEKTK